MRRLLGFSSITLFSLLAACTVSELTTPGQTPTGTGTGSGTDVGGGAAVDPDAPDAAPMPEVVPPSFALTAVTPGAELELGSRSELELSVSSQNFAGPVTLSAANMAEGWTVSFDPAVIEVPLDGVATATLIVETATDAEAATRIVEVRADGAPGPSVVNVQLDVANQVIIPITGGTGAGAHSFPDRTAIRVGTTVIFRNDDGAEHRIHAGADDEGLPHQEGSMKQGESYVATITAEGSFRYYCHEHEVGAGVGRIVATNPVAPATP